MRDMLLTIGIPTWNRANILRRTLIGLYEAIIPKGVSLEILVVDNNSADETQDVLEKYKKILPLRPLFEPQQGRSWALNHAIAKARGEYILWIDDDILVDTKWIDAYYRAFSEFPDAGFFGGRIVPLFEGTPPEWMISALPVIGGVFGTCDPNEGPIRLNDSFLPFGGNMAVRLELQRRFLFDVRLGRQGGKMMAGEEAQMIRDMLQSGIEGRWVPTARVEHIIPVHMQTLAHIRRYFHDWGATTTIQREEIKSKNFSVGPLWAWRQLIESEIRYRLGKALRISPQVWVKELRYASQALGVLHKRPMKIPEGKNKA